MITILIFNISQIKGWFDGFPRPSNTIYALLKFIPLLGLLGWEMWAVLNIGEVIDTLLEVPSVISVINFCRALGAAFITVEVCGFSVFVGDKTIKFLKWLVNKADQDYDESIPPGSR